MKKRIVKSFVLMILLHNFFILSFKMYKTYYRIIFLKINCMAQIFLKNKITELVQDNNFKMNKM